MSLALEIEISVEMVEAVLREYEAENPGRNGRDMTPDEFSARMMKKVRAGIKWGVPEEPKP